MISAELTGGRDFRTAVGLFLAPVVGLLSMMLVVTVPGILDEISVSGVGGVGRLLLLAFGSFLLGMALGLPIAFLLGWPLHMLLLRLGWTHPISYLLFGACLGTVASFGHVGLLSGTAPAGAVGGLLFWLVRRPDRDQKAV